MALQQITANDIVSLPSGSVSNTQFATGAVETYMSAQSSSFGFRNRIINGAMVIDQRNGGASQTPTSNSNIVDRWAVTMGQASKFTTQLSTNAPAGFTSSLQISTTSAYSGSYFYLYQYIEGYNFADMAWGTSSAKPVTVSFWVNSSITGTFGSNFFRNNAQDTQPTFSYTVNNSNTWEYKTVTVSGQTTGTWLTNNGIGTGVFFNLANTIGTLGATFYITGVQVEKGSTASAFEYRDYGRELLLCQRYYINYGTSFHYDLAQVSTYYTTRRRVAAFIAQGMRATPTASYTLGSDGGYTGDVFSVSNNYNWDVYAISSGPGATIYLTALTFSAEL